MPLRTKCLMLFNYSNEYMSSGNARVYDERLREIFYTNENTYTSLHFIQRNQLKCMTYLVF